MHRVFLRSVGSVMGIGLLAAPGAVRAEETRPETEFELAASSGVSHFTTIHSALTVGVDLGVRWRWLKVGGLGQYALSPSGKATTLAATAGVSFPVSLVDLDLLSIVGQHSYFDVGAVRSSSSSFGVSGCGDFTGLDGRSSVLGLSIGIRPHARLGTHVLWGLSAFYLRDLSHEHMTRSEKVTCGLLGTGSETRTAEADVGGNQIGLALRLGLDAGW